jgi:hypothetical protein
MAQKTRANLTTQANTIKNETATAANTATRVGTMHVDDIDSEVNWLSDVETTLTNSSTKVPRSDAVFTAIAAKQDTLTAANMHTYVDSLTALTTPVDSDRMIIVDNSASLAKKITWANIKATLKTYFDAIYQTILISGTSIKTINSTSVLGSGDIAVEPTITTLPISKGGTNSGTALSNNRVMRSSSGAIVEAAAITASRALKSDANGIPTHFDTATEPSLTELSYVKGVTSAIQTQIDTVNITISTSSNITTNTLDANSVNQHGHNVMISNGANAINLTLETSSTASFCASYTKLGSAAITFVAGSGATLVQMDGTAVLNGAVGSTACLTRTGNTYYLQISNR